MSNARGGASKYKMVENHPTEEESLETITISTLLNDQDDLDKIIPKFSKPLKTNFEDRNLWLRLGLALSLSKNRYKMRSALQAFHECMRLDPLDPLPAMLAAKLMLEELDEPEDGLELIMEAIERCKETSPLLSRCYLMASIMYAYMYEREPESIKPSKSSHFESSMKYLNLAKVDGDHLVYFHQALHDAKRKLYCSAIDMLRKSIGMNPQHVPSIHLMILSLSALKMFTEALNLCESSIIEFEDNLLLLYMKCNLEQCLVETRGYKFALGTAQYILKRIRGLRRSPEVAADGAHQDPPKPSNNLFADDVIGDNRKRQDPFTQEMTIWLLVAEIFIKIGSISDAELCVDEASLHATGALSYQILFIRGLISKAKNNLNEARSFFQSCLALSPRHPKALQQLAHVHYLLGNHSIAEKFLKDSLDLDADCHRSWHFLSLVYIQTNQHDKAKECEKKATDLEGSMPMIPLSTIPRLTLM